MHALTIRTRFAFNDHVRFDSQTQRCSGQGKVFAITIGADGQIDYWVETMRDDGCSDLQAGILEDELSLMASEEQL